LEDIKRECLFLYDFTKKYPVESITEIIPNATCDQTNQIVKQQMILHGVEYVRGGSYTDIELSKEQIAVINAEISYNIRATKTEIMLGLYNEIADASVEKQSEIKDSWSRYMALKEQHNGLVCIPQPSDKPPIILDCEWLYGELEWMKTQLTDQLIHGISKDGSNSNSNNVADFQRYMTIIPYIKRLPSIAESIRVNNNADPFDFRKIFRPMNTASSKETWPYATDEPQAELDTYLLEYDYDSEGTHADDFAIFVNNPQFIFDSYFVTHRWTSLDHPKTAKFILHIFAIIQYYSGYVRNYLAELDHDISHFAFITDMKYDQIPPTVWGDIYSEFIDKYWCLANYDVSASPNADGTANLANDDVL